METPIFLYNFLLFYGIRSVIQANFIFKFTEGFYWDPPWIPSLVVPYGRYSDYYYSGHTGCLTFIALRLWKLGYKKVSIFSAASMIYVIFVLLSFGVHYSIDICIGFIAGVHSYLVANRIKSKFDVFIRFILTKICRFKTIKEKIWSLVY